MSCKPVLHRTLMGNKMKKLGSGNSVARSVPLVTQSTILYPVTTEGQDEDKELLQDEDINCLQKISQIEFNKDVRAAIRRIAAAWRFHDRALQSPRPKEFRARLRQMETAMAKAVTLLELDDTAGHLDYQLQNWLINASCGGELLLVSASVCEQARLLINLLRCAQKNLPEDNGRARPLNDDRYIIYLADQFEASGGTALAYRDTYQDSGYALTPFRDFMHQLYRRLQLVSRRTESGLDEAIIRALTYRRKQRKG
jgi:hypothetical protein